MHVRTGTKIQVTFSGKPDSVEFIRDKLNGNSLHYKELLSIVKDITADRLTDIEKKQIPFATTVALNVSLFEINV